MRNSVDWAHVRRVACAVRDWSEFHARRASNFDFHRSEDLTGMCAYASTVLMACLHRMGIKQAVLVANHEHAHVRIRNRIIDITATQFWTGEDVRDRVEIASLTSLKARYTRDPQAWDAEWTFQSIDDAFDALHPASQNGFCEGQYWKTRSAMYRAIAQALHFCASRGLAQVGGPECSNADLACARRLKI